MGHMENGGRVMIIISAGGLRSFPTVSFSDTILTRRHLCELILDLFSRCNLVVSNGLFATSYLLPWQILYIVENCRNVHSKRICGILNDM